jgi:general secretion pathway protein D
MKKFGLALGLFGCVCIAVAQAPPPANPPAQGAQPAAQPGAQPAQPGAQPAAQPATPAPATPNPATPTVTQTPGPAPSPAPAQATPTTLPPSPGGGPINLQNASLVEVIENLARILKINYILDKRVVGSVTISTYGETKNIDTRNLLDLILRINGFAMIQVGDIYRIVPLNEVNRLPLKPDVNPKNIPEDDRTMLNLVFLKYATVADLATLISNFQGEGATTVTYPPANLLLIQDSRRNMKRLMDLIALFDSNEFASQRVRLFEVKEGKPSDIAKELESILKSISLNEKTAPIKFLPIDRINTIIAVAPNPGAFDEIEKWIKKLDVPIQITAGSIDNYVYRVKYGRSETLAGAIMQLYGGGFGGGYGGGYGGYGSGGGFPGAGLPGGAYGSPGTGSYPGGPGGSGYSPSGAYGPGGNNFSGPAPGVIPTAPLGPGGMMGAGMDQTGSYLTGGAPGVMGRIPRIVPNPLDNSLLIQGTPQEYAGILKLLKELDIAPRQVLIEAKIYEVDISGAFQMGVQATLNQRSSKEGLGLEARQFVASSVQGTLNLSAGMLVGRSRELLAALSTNELATRSKVISAPSIIATDSIQASINVGTEVPTLTSQSATGVQSGGTSLFAQNIQNRNSGVTLSILARVNPSGIVTLVINQEVSAPQPPENSSAIQSPSFSKRSVQTQVTVQDGDTIAIGGIIDEKSTESSGGIPYLHRIPVLGAAFGSKTFSKTRTELIIFMTPRVIYDTNEMADASDELKTQLRRVLKNLKSKE